MCIHVTWYMRFINFAILKTKMTSNILQNCSIYSNFSRFLIRHSSFPNLVTMKVVAPSQLAFGVCDVPTYSHRENGGTLGMEGPSPLFNPPKEPFKRGLGPNNYQRDIRSIWFDYWGAPHPKGFYQHFPYDTGSMVSQSAKELIDPSRFILFYKEVVQLRPQDLQILQAWKHYFRWFWMYNFFTCPPEQLLSYKNVLSSDQRPAWWVYIYNIYIILYYQWYTHISTIFFLGFCYLHEGL